MTTRGSAFFLFRLSGSLCVWLMLMLLQTSSRSAAFVASPLLQRRGRSAHQLATRNNLRNCGWRLLLLHSNTNDNNPEPQGDKSSQTTLQRTRLAGVSVSPPPDGSFWVVLQTADPDAFWPVCVAAAANDPPLPSQTAAATLSAPALTLLQLLAGVDLAGPVLPPNVLAEAVVLACEEAAASSNLFVDRINAAVQTAVRRCWDQHVSSNNSKQQQSYRYTDQTDWIRSRVGRLPTVALDRVVWRTSPSTTNAATLDGSTIKTTSDDSSSTANTTSAAAASAAWELQCTVTLDDNAKEAATAISIPLTESVVEQLGRHYREDDDSAQAGVSSQAFVAIALALRYRVPIFINSSSGVNNNDDNDAPSTGASSSTSRTNATTPALPLSRSQLAARFPAYRPANEVRQPAERSAAAIARGFEIHKLQAAWQIARERQDWPAAARIRKELDRRDAEQDLPVQAETDTSRMQ